jgi:hypothetical protein
MKGDEILELDQVAWVGRLSSIVQGIACVCKGDEQSREDDNMLRDMWLSSFPQIETVNTTRSDMSNALASFFRKFADYLEESIDVKS